MQMDTGGRLIPGCSAAHAGRRGWPSAVSLVAHGAAIALAVWLAAVLRPLPPAVPQAGVRVIFSRAPSAAPLAPPGMPAAPQPLTAAAALPPTPSAPLPPNAAASPPATPSPPEALSVPALPPALAPPVQPHERRDVRRRVRHELKDAAATGPALVLPNPSARQTALMANTRSAPLLPPRPVSGTAANVPPSYPESARRRGQQGRVVLRVAVSATGHPLAVTVMHSSGYRVLDAAAADAVQQWRFVPASRAGVPQPGVTEVPIHFELRN